MIGYLPETGYLRTSPDIDRAYSRSRVYPGDLVVAIRAALGKALLVPHYLSVANLTQGTAKVSPGIQVDSRFLFWAFNSHCCQDQIQRVAKGATFKEITLEELRQIVIAIPPVDEQIAITQHLDEATKSINNTVSLVLREIDLMTEYRTALIAEAVTGRLDLQRAK